MKRTITFITLILLCVSMVSASFTTSVELKLSNLTGISSLDNSVGDAITISIIHSNGTVIVSGNAAAGVYSAGMSIPLSSGDITLDYGTDYTFNLSTAYGDFLYNFTTPSDPSSAVVGLHSGQTSSYGTAPDDADNDGISKSYTDEGCGSGTVLDDHTGLCWQKDDQPSRDWESAKSYCDGLSLGGHSDWRLPSVVEGVTMLDYSCSSSSLSHCAASFQNVALTWDDGSNNEYWTSTTRPDNTDLAFTINAGKGYPCLTPYVQGGVTSNYKTSSLYVRCVRST